MSFITLGSQNYTISIKYVNTIIGRASYQLNTNMPGITNYQIMAVSKKDTAMNSNVAPINMAISFIPTEFKFFKITLFRGMTPAGSFELKAENIPTKENPAVNLNVN